MYFKFTGRHIRFFHFRFSRILFLWVPMEPDPENIPVAVGISLISRPGVEKHLFQVFNLDKDDLGDYSPISHL